MAAAAPPAGEVVAPLQLALPLYAAPVQQESGPSIELAGQRITYQLRRSRRRRTIALLIDERGLRVAAPMRSSQAAIDAMLREHGAWVLRKTDEWRSRQAAPLRWEAGETIMFQGGLLHLAARTDMTMPERDDSRLWYGPATLRAAQIAALVSQWLKQQALSCFGELCHRYSAQLGVATPTVRLSNARTRWGSCHANGRIRMNWRLVQAPLPWIEYVAAHEVAHLRQMNHAPAFWRTVADLVPDYAERRAALRRHVHRYLLL